MATNKKQSDYERLSRFPKLKPTPVKVDTGFLLKHLEHISKIKNQQGLKTYGH